MRGVLRIRPAALSLVALLVTIALLPLGSPTASAAARQTGDWLNCYACTFAYSDADGPGTITLTPVETFVAVGGTPFMAQLDQNGTRFSGFGVIRNADDPLGPRILFSLQADGGPTNLYQGLMSGSGDTFAAAGVLIVGQDANTSEHWTIGVPRSPQPAIPASLAIVQQGTFSHVGDVEVPPAPPHTLPSASDPADALSGPPSAVGQPGETLLFQAQPTSGAFKSVTWLFGDGTAADSADTVEHVYSTPGDYLLTAIRYDEHGYNGFVVASIHVGS